ncbi:PP2C family protein-serine/threonine phosphatase [Phormidesmis sp. 146-35]
MDNDRPILQCPNYFCQALNPESHKFCHKCRTLLLKRYLWAVGHLESDRSGDLLGDRYLFKSDQILLDTKPGAPPETPPELPPRWESYLRLFPYRLHVPQVYGWIRDKERPLAGNSKSATSPIYLLETAPIYPAGATLEDSDLAGQLMPTLESLWSRSTPLRQLDWLWQIASFWQPFSSEKVASTLLDPTLLRVDGACLKLLELKFDKQPPDLSALGQLWSTWNQQPDASDRLPISYFTPSRQVLQSEFLTPLCDQLIQGQITHADQLLDLLDQGIAKYGQVERQIQIATATDQGPSRQSNEDACYPPGGSVLTVNLSENQANPLVIVCDGIGGHEGGEVASGLAIATLQSQAESLFASNLDAATLVDGLERATFAANDAISQRNDTEQRHERQRMGTTVVMALAHKHELYITHVGDSRAYRITRTGCYQVTLDDDVASREVRLGYALYRDALQQPASGSLVQALGMGSSDFLHPTVQRFVLDEDCVFLLCSDGLSDHDRIEEVWDSEIAPILDGNADLGIVSQRLVEIANTRNGHDNVTIGLVYCRVNRSESTPTPSSINWQQSARESSGATALPQAADDSPDETPVRTQIIQPPRSPFSWLPPFLTLTALLGVSGLLLYLLVPELRARVNPIAVEPSPPLTTPSPEPIPSAVPTDSPSPTVGASIDSANPLLAVGSFVRLDQKQKDLTVKSVDLGSVNLLNLPGPADATSATSIVGRVPIGSILQVVGKQTMTDQRSWLRLKVCSVAGSAATSSSTPLPRLVKPGEAGWLEEATIAPYVAQNFSIKPDQLGQCASP